MYRSFYNLNSKPFQISSDPDFMWLGEKHKEALATLKYGVLDNKGFLLLTGDVGTGKTTLINALMESLSSDVICASVPDPSLERSDFFNYIGSAFGIGDSFSSKGVFLSEFSKFLHRTYDEKKKVLLIIDEAQLLTQELLEEIRLLSNIERTDTKLVNIFFIGQNEFNEILNQEKNRAVRQRLTLHYIIDPLTPEETNLYIQHRLHVAGNDKRIFTPLAIREIHSFSEGFPRRINVICDHCLLTGYASEKRTIDDFTVQECGRELKIPTKITRQHNHYYSADIPHNPSPEILQSRQEHHITERDHGGFLQKAALCAVFLLLCIFYGDLFLQKVVQKTESYLSKSSQPLNRKTANGFPDASSSSQDFAKLDIAVIQPDPLPSFQHVSLEVPPQRASTLATPNLSQPQDPLSKQSPEHLVKTPLAKNTAGPPQDKQVHGPTLSMPTDTLTIYFKYNSNEFEREELEKLDEFASVFAMHPESKLFLKGHTDSDGDGKFNRKLSTFRANLVKSYLLGKGAKATQIHVEGFGSSQPVESNNTAMGRKMNRRVEIEILPP